MRPTKSPLMAATVRNRLQQGAPYNVFTRPDRSCLRVRFFFGRQCAAGPKLRGRWPHYGLLAGYLAHRRTRWNAGLDIRWFPAQAFTIRTLTRGAKAAFSDVYCIGTAARAVAPPVAQEVQWANWKVWWIFVIADHLTGSTLRATRAINCLRPHTAGPSMSADRAPCTAVWSSQCILLR